MNLSLVQEFSSNAEIRRTEKNEPILADLLGLSVLGDHKKPDIVLGNFLPLKSLFYSSLPKSGLNVPFVVQLELGLSNAELQTDS